MSLRSTEQAIATLGEFASKYAYPIETAMIEGGIEAPLEKAHFVAVLGHESSGFKRLTENLNYSEDRLEAVFSKYFPTQAERRRFAHNPVMIANRVYAGRIGNGDEASGDGWRYRGRGFIQLTGKANYREASEALFGDPSVLIDNPDLAAEPLVAARAAVHFWNKRHIKDYALADDITEVTRKVNGGAIGLDDRKEWLRKTKRAFSV
jgi:putative chitinase